MKRFFLVGMLLFFSVHAQSENGQNKVTMTYPDGRRIDVTLDGNKFVVKRFKNNGELDTTFSYDGVTQTIIGDNLTLDRVFLKDGDVVVEGTRGQDHEPVSVYYTPKGELDGLIGIGGIVSQ